MMISQAWVFFGCFHGKRARFEGNMIVNFLKNAEKEPLIVDKCFSWLYNNFVNSKTSES